MWVPSFLCRYSFCDIREDRPGKASLSKSCGCFITSFDPISLDQRSFQTPRKVSISLIQIVTRANSFICSLNGGVQDVMQHPWFSGVDWQALLDRRVTAPIIPNRTSAGDTTNFQKYGAQDTNDMPGIRSRDAFLQDQSRHDIYRHLFPDF